MVNHLAIALKENGYVEKDHIKDIYTDAIGSKNITKYAAELFPDLQGQPWCDMFVDWCMVKAYGKVQALEMLGGFSAYTPTSANYFKKANRYVSVNDIRVHDGSVIFFKNSTRICHTGFILDAANDYIRTIEGNTSSETGVVSNGGMVCIKKYAYSNPRIAGVGIFNPFHYEIGWNNDENGWFYCPTETEYLKNTWQVINGHRYYFQQDGYAVTDWQEIDGKWYYFEPRAGHPLECALYTTAEDHSQIILEV